MSAGRDELGPKQPTTFSFFIYGASIFVGLYAARLARRAAESNGSTVQLIGIAGQEYFERLKAEPYCEDDLIEYHEIDWPWKVRYLTNEDYAYDCISEGSMVSKTGSTLAPSGKMAIVRSREGDAWSAHALPF